jgi:hypothetical protein
MSAAPSALVRAVKSTAQARAGTIKASGLPATTHPVSSPVVAFSKSRRFKVTSSSIGSPPGRQIVLQAGI